MILAELPPLTLYLHLPWCLHKCAYCDFNSHPATTPLDEDRYITALLADLELELPLVAGRSVSALFIGGGTPSLFSPAAIQRLLTGIGERLSLQPGLEVTLEANPGALDSGHLAGYRAAGVNRLSLGVQSFDPEALQRLGRIHTPAMALAAIAEAQAVGFPRINIDLMYGLPQHSPAAALADLAQALDLGINHLSRYQLTLEPGTELYRHPPPLPDEEQIAEIEAQGEALLLQRGVERYEVSAYARRGEACQHNLNYWHFGDYLGIGAGAHGKVTTHQAILRRRRRANPQAYLRQAGHAAAVPDSYPLTHGDLIAEFMLNALRLHHGFPLSLFAARTGLPASAIAQPLATAQAQGLLRTQADWIQPTPLGAQFLNDLMALFVEV